jgi:hypothetical protein
LDKGRNNLHVFGGSLMVIKWMRGHAQIHNLELFSIVEQLKLITGNFQDLRFTHIFRELNQENSNLSKEGMELMEKKKFLFDNHDG